MSYSATRLLSLARCPREHHLRYVERLATVPTAQLAFGTLMHSALEAYYQAWQAGSDRLSAALAVAGEDPRARVLCIAYDARWGAEAWTVRAVEADFIYRVGDDEIVGKVDALIEDAAGDLWVVEHKTTSASIDPGTPYWERLALDLQCSIYLDGARASGLDVRGIIYDVLAVPRHQPLLATAAPKMTQGKPCKLCRGTGNVGDATCAACDGSTWREPPRPYAGQRLADETPEEFENRVVEAIAAAPDEYLVRNVVVRLDHEIEPIRRDLAEWIQIDRVTSALRVAPRATGACQRGRQMCDFFDLCAGRAQLEHWPRRINNG